MAHPISEQINSPGLPDLRQDPYYRRLFEVLLNGPRTRDELASELNTDRHSVSSALGYLSRRMRQNARPGDPTSVFDPGSIIVRRVGGIYVLTPAGKDVARDFQ